MEKSRLLAIVDSGGPASRCANSAGTEAKTVKVAAWGFSTSPRVRSINIDAASVCRDHSKRFPAVPGDRRRDAVTKLPPICSWDNMTQEHTAV